MRILMAAGEMSPFAKSGGLGDVLEALPSQLVKNGHDVCVVVPCYRTVTDSRDFAAHPTGITLDIRAGSRRHRLEVLEQSTGTGLQVFFLKEDALFGRDGLYGEHGHDYPDNAERFIVFSKAVVELARRIRPAVDILHVHDWQAALVPVLVKAFGLPFKTVLTIHNLAYQGNFWGIDFALTDLPGQYFSGKGLEFYGNLNLLKGGILYADALTTVSETYARDILMAEFGCGLDGVLRERRRHLFGFTNGIDTDRWNPARDSRIAKKFRPSALAGKKACRKDLLERLGLDADPAGPVFMVISRLAEQKGIDLLIPLLDRLLADDVRLVIVGEGDPAYEVDLLSATRRYPERLAYRMAFDEDLAHRVQAGADICLSPSRFEPCGLTAMVALRYGTVPVAHAVGGLFQMIRNHEPEAPDGNGILFYEYTPAAFWDAIVRAKKLFGKTAKWREIMKNGMSSDFSWGTAVSPYETLYGELLKK